MEAISSSFPRSLSENQAFDEKDRAVIANARFNALKAFFDEDDEYMRFKLIRELRSAPTYESIAYLSKLAAEAKAQGDLFFTYETKQSIEVINGFLGDLDKYFEKNAQPAGLLLSSGKSKESEQEVKELAEQASEPEPIKSERPVEGYCDA